MSLSEINHEDRVIFLQLFVKELIGAVVKQKIRKKRIEVEKLRQRFVTREINTKESMKPAIKSNNLSNQIDMPYASVEKQLTRHLAPRQIIQHQIKARPRFPLQNQTPKQIVKSISPQPSQMPQGFNLGKVNTLLTDSSIQAIECSGPGNNLLVKRYNKINTSGITLSQDDINFIIGEFSRKAKIPIIGGLFKAAVGNLLISAVISNFVGSRFIITKITPYSLIYD